MVTRGPLSATELGLWHLIPLVNGPKAMVRAANSSTLPAAIAPACGLRSRDVICQTRTPPEEPMPQRDDPQGNSYRQARSSLKRNAKPDAALEDQLAGMSHAHQ